MKPEVRKAIYSIVLSVLYGGPICYLFYVALCKITLSIQRDLVLCDIKCYSTSMRWISFPWCFSEWPYYYSNLVFEALTWWDDNVDNIDTDSIHILKNPLTRDSSCRIQWTPDLSQRNPYRLVKKNEEVRCAYLFATKEEILKNDRRIDSLCCRRVSSRRQFWMLFWKVSMNSIFFSDSTSTL